MSAVSIPQAFALALQHQQAGRLADAEALYRQILAVQPNHADAWQYLGVIAGWAGRHDLAVALMNRAIVLNPNSPEAHSNLGNVYRSMGRLDDAAASFRRALQLKPDHPEALSNLGIVLAAQGRLDEAIAAYRRALLIKPGYAEIHNNLGLALAENGRPGEAIATYRRALELRPNYPEAWCHLGVALAGDGLPEEAIGAYRRALVLKPDYPEAHHSLGLALAATDQLEDAVAAYRRSLALQPACAEAWNNLGAALAGQDLFDEAMAAFRRALELRPAYPEAENNLGNILRDQDRLDEAAACFQRALALQPDFPEAHLNMGLTWSMKGLFHEAEACYRGAIACRADFADAHLNLGLVLLLLGRYEEGWREYEWRWRVPAHAFRQRHFSAPLWDGKPVVGQTILIHAEQGFGDTLQFLRYLPLVRQHSRAARVILECQPGLVLLLQSFHGAEIDIVARGLSEATLPPFDQHLPLLSLPLVLSCFGPLSVSVPYLHADLGLRAQWRERLGARPEFRVGLVWAGNPEHGTDRYRSIVPERLSPLWRVPGVCFVSLQIEPTGPLPPTLAATGVLDFTAQIHDFADSAALIAELDLIITVDTAAAHLAGALGRPAWVLLPFAPDWRWGLAREDTTWYPSLRLFRQPVAGDWDAVIQRVAEELCRVAADRV